jgi:hypothetical protein
MVPHDEGALHIQPPKEWRRDVEDDGDALRDLNSVAALR